MAKIATGIKIAMQINGEIGSRSPIMIPIIKGTTILIHGFLSRNASMSICVSLNKFTKKYSNLFAKY